MSDRERLETLRKRKRLMELRAKRDAAQSTPATPTSAPAPRKDGMFNDGDGFFERLGDNPLADSLRERFPSLYKADEAVGESRVASAAAGAGQGATFGLQDEIASLPAAIIPGGETGQQARVRMRGETDAHKSRHPLSFLGGEFAGALGSGGGGLARMGAVKGGALTGGAYGFGTAEGNAVERLDDTAMGAALGAAGGKAFDFVGGQLANFARSRAGKKMQEALPSLDDLRGIRDDAYKRVDDLGAVYSPNQIAALRQGIADEIPASGFGGITPTTHPTTTTAMRQLADLPDDAPVSLTQLDNFRQLANSASVTNPKDGRLGGKIASNIDDFVGSIDPATGGREAGDAILEARNAHSRLKQSEMLDDLLYKAVNRAASGGSGANSQNAARQNIRRILDDPKKRRGFSEDAIAQMERVVRGTPAMNATRLVGKAAPTGIVSGGIGSGAGFALGGPVGGFAVPAIGYLAKKKSDDLAQGEIDRLIRMVRTGSKAKPQADTKASKLLDDPRTAGLMNYLAIVGAN